MSIIWDTLINCKEQIIKEFDSRGKEIQEEGMAQFNQPDNGWINRVWQTVNYTGLIGVLIKEIQLLKSVVKEQSELVREQGNELKLLKDGNNKFTR